MSRQPLPGADELFRPTVPAVRGEPGNGQGVLDGFEGLVPPPESPARGTPKPAGVTAADGPSRTRRGEGPVDGSASKRPGRRATRTSEPLVNATSGRERHEEKITVYVSRSELLELERARLVLRGEHGVAVDRGRIVREALATVLGDLQEHGEASILVRRLAGT